MSSDEESIVEIPDEIGGEGDDNPIETIEEAPEETPQNNENKDSDDEESKKVVKPKRVIKNPQPKLNEQTLRTPKGLPAISGHFKRVKFRGRGFEEQDLNVLMKTYEYWCHRLIPKFPFDSCIARLEGLGTKKTTQVLLKRIRLGMEFEDEDKKIISDEEQEADTPTTEGFVDTFNNQFDQLLTGNNETERIKETTEEQLERMRQNKLRAEALRKQRLERMKSDEEANNEIPQEKQSSTSEVSDMNMETEITDEKNIRIRKRKIGIIESDDDMELAEDELNIPSDKSGDKTEQCEFFSNLIESNSVLEQESPEEPRGLKDSVNC
ncbi:hypothetical protein JTB14_011443 [Gonioctena quinquepunctata]|nr:hypothetical protein JTB14_011443 [Gonioctena quinquepunctata]